MIIKKRRTFFVHLLSIISIVLVCSCGTKNKSDCISSLEEKETIFVEKEGYSFESSMGPSLLGKFRTTKPELTNDYYERNGWEDAYDKTIPYTLDIGQYFDGNIRLRQPYADELLEKGKEYTDLLKENTEIRFKLFPYSEGYTIYLAWLLQDEFHCGFYEDESGFKPTMYKAKEATDYFNVEKNGDAEIDIVRNNGADSYLMYMRNEFDTCWLYLYLITMLDTFEYDIFFVQEDTLENTPLENIYMNLRQVIFFSKNNGFDKTCLQHFNEQPNVHQYNREWMKRQIIEDNI